MVPINPARLARAMSTSGELFDQPTLDRLYPGGKAEYLRHFEVALDRSIRSGFILFADRQEIFDVAAASYPGTR